VTLHEISSAFLQLAYLVAVSELHAFDSSFFNTRLTKAFDHLDRMAR